MNSTTDPSIKNIKKRNQTRAPGRLCNILCLDDFEMAAKRHLPGPIYTYYSSSVETRYTHRENRRIFSDYEFITQTLVDTESRSQKITLFGKTWEHPFGIAPMGLCALGAYDGDVVTAKTADQRGLPYALSAASLSTLERVASQGNGKWFQTYLPGEPDRIQPMIERIIGAGYETLILTVDAPVGGNPENQKRGGFSSPLQPSLSLAWQGLTHPGWLFGTAARTLVKHGMPHFENMDAERGPPIISPNLERELGDRDRLTWDHVSMIRKLWPGNLVIKGLLSAKDVKLASQKGSDAVIISNHGGRQLDGAVSSLSALPACVKSAGEMPVLVDSGFRRGSDVLKAYALGASFVFVGRPFLYAASVAGADGINHCIDLLSNEISRNMAMLGVTEVSRAQLQPLLISK